MKTALGLITVIILTGCSLTETAVSPGGEFTLKKGQTARVKNTDLQVKMLSNGHSTLVSGGHVMFCEFEVRFNGQTEKKTLDIGESAKFENLEVKLAAVDTTADPKASDPWSSTSCKFTVTGNTK